MMKRAASAPVIASLAAFGVAVAACGTPAAARDIVAFESAKYPIGTIVIDTAGRRLYYSLGNGQAIKYKVAVGKPGYQWFGETFVEKKKKDPGWYPTARMRRAGAPRYVAPGPRNPLGVRAIYLGWSEYRIHGTNAPSSIGRAASSGCIRMLNEDVTDLFERVHIGAPVHVVRSLGTDISSKSQTKRQGERS